MDSIFAISLGFALRLVVDAASHHNNRLGGSLIGLWEGAVLYHFLEKWPTSVDPYVGLGFRLLVDFLFTESVIRIAIILLWTGLGFIISDVTPAFWYDKNLYKFYRRTRRFIRHFDWNLLKIPLPAAAISRVRFYDAPSFGPPESATSIAPSSQRRHSVPGNFPGYSSPSTDSSFPPFSTLRRPVPATSLPPSALRPVGRPQKPASTSSVSFDVVPPTSEIPPIDDDLYDDGDYDQPPPSPPQEQPPLREQRTPTPRLVPPPIIAMPVPQHTRTVSGEDASPTLLPTANTDKPPPVVVVMAPDLTRTNSAGPPTNIDALPEIIEPQDDDANADNPAPDPDPPPPFDAQGGPPPPGASAPLRDWGTEKLAVRNPELLSERPSARSSVVSGGNRESIIVRADLLREQAHAEEKERDRLHAEHKRAFGDKRYPDAVRFKVEQEEANERAMNLHRRAAERYFKAHNIQPEERTIDVHRLKAKEAVRRTEVGIRDALVAGDTRLRVICGRGNHSERRIPVLKLALIGAMDQHRIETEVDPGNPGVLIVKLPAS